MRERGNAITDKEAKELMKEADTNKDGVISFDGTRICFCFVENRDTNRKRQSKHLMLKSRSTDDHLHKTMLIRHIKFIADCFCSIV